ncbi:MAG: hypothetical protein HYX36_14155 [Rhizobiales bacterium]|nr:hypothetical protein [Hyphomicrobiales bacterium]
MSPAISIVEVLYGVARHKRAIGLATLLAFGGGLALVNVLKPVYTAEAQVLIENLETPFDRVQAANTVATASGGAVDDRVVASQMSVVRSDDLGRRVVATLHLEQNAEFNVLLNGLGLPAKVKLALGFGEDPRLKTPEVRALDHYTNELSVYQLPQSNVIGIKYTAATPEIAAEIANTLAETYVMATRESQSQPTERAREWLSQQIDTLRGKVARSERAVEEFRTKAGLLRGATTTLGAQQISELSSQITVAQTASTEAQARADAVGKLLSGKGSIENSSEVLASATIQKLKEQRTDATRRLAELSATYLPGHPKIIAAQGEIADIDKQMRSEAHKIVTGLEDQARIAGAREAALRASLETMKTRESASNLDDVKLKALERDAAADRALLETLLARYAEASARLDAAAQPGLARIIQSAPVLSAPSFPKRGPLVLLITLAGLVVATGFAFLAEIMAAANRITAGVVETPTELPVRKVSMAPAVAEIQREPVMAPAPPASLVQPLASLPRLPAKPNQAIAVVEHEASVAGGQMATWADGLMREASASRFAITGMNTGDGDCSVAAVVLARALAAQGRRVIIADLAAAGSWLETLCGIAEGPGIADLVTGAAPFTKVIGRDKFSTVHLLRFGHDRSERAIKSVNDRMESVLAALGQTYDAVVVNGGERVADETAVVERCQAVLVVAPVSRFSDAAATVQALARTGQRAARLVIAGQAGSAAELARRTVSA